MIDGHIHALPGPADAKGLAGHLRRAGFAGGGVISPAPPCFGTDLAGKSPEERIESVLAWTEGQERLYPFLWIDPLEAGAARQVRRALKRGIAAFKVICSHHHPGDRRAMKIYAAIAEAGRPMLFHAGILWDLTPSSRYSRPAGFEVLLKVPRLRFALAHVGWPWCDELIAVYGKFMMARRQQPHLAVEMFVDTTPGTPVVYRREVLTKLFTVGYDIERNVIFGSDGRADCYDVGWARGWLARDRRICREVNLSAEDQRRYFGGNLMRFLTGRTEPPAM